MYAALVRLTIDPEHAPAAAKALTSDILPRVRSASGFVAGYWLEPADGQGFSIVLFETEEQARDAAPPVNSWAAPGIAITGVELRRVAQPPEPVAPARSPTRGLHDPRGSRQRRGRSPASSAGCETASKPFDSRIESCPSPTTTAVPALCGESLGSARSD